MKDSYIPLEAENSERIAYTMRLYSTDINYVFFRRF
jgi:hypothetical protein